MFHKERRIFINRRTTHYKVGKNKFTIKYNTEKKKINAPSQAGLKISIITSLSINLLNCHFAKSLLNTSAICSIVGR